MQKKSYHQEIYRLHDPSFSLPYKMLYTSFKETKNEQSVIIQVFFFSLTSLIEASTIEENPTTFVINSSN